MIQNLRTTLKIQSSHETRCPGTSRRDGGRADSPDGTGGYNYERLVQCSISSPCGIRALQRHPDRRLPASPLPGERERRLARVRGRFQSI